MAGGLIPIQILRPDLRKGSEKARVFNPLQRRGVGLNSITNQLMNNLTNESTIQ